MNTIRILLVDDHAMTRIELTRLAPRRLDSDNLAGSCKHIRDGIADWFGVDDGDARYQWAYAQEKSKEYGVRVTITPLAASKEAAA